MSKSVTILAFGLLVIVTRVLVAIFAPGALDYLQLGVFFLAVAALWWCVAFSVSGITILSRLGIVFAVLGGVVGASYDYSILRSDQVDGRPVYVTRLADDASGGASRILREAIDGRQGGLAKRFYRTIDSPRVLAELFDKAQGESGIVWGNSQLVKFSPSPKPAVKLKELQLSNGIPQNVVSARLGELLLINDIPVIGISYAPIPATGEFIAGLIEAARTTGDTREVWLESSGRMNARWRATQHQGYPFFLLATDLMRNYIVGGGREIALVQCAIRDFQSALGFLKTGGNPEFLAAVRNNLAIAKALLAEAEGASFKSSRKDFELARRLARYRDPFGLGGTSARIADKNARLLFAQGTPSKTAVRGIAKRNRGKKHSEKQPNEGRHGKH